MMRECRIRKGSPLEEKGKLQADPRSLATLRLPMVVRPQKIPQLFRKESKCRQRKLAWPSNMLSRLTEAKQRKVAALLGRAQ